MTHRQLYPCRAVLQLCSSNSAAHPLTVCQPGIIPSPQIAPALVLVIDVIDIDPTKLMGQ